MSSNPGSVKVLSVDRNEVFGSGNDEDIRLFCIAVSRQALVGPSRDRRQRKLPPEPERDSCGPKLERPDEVGIGTVIEPEPVTVLAANFSSTPRIAPPPFGNEICGALIRNLSSEGAAARASERPLGAIMGHTPLALYLRGRLSQTRHPYNRFMAHVDGRVVGARHFARPRSSRSRACRRDAPARPADRGFRRSRRSWGRVSRKPSLLFLSSQVSPAHLRIIGQFQ
jgi:hypothetical protein